MDETFNNRKKPAGKLNALLNRRYKFFNLLIFCLVLGGGYVWLAGPAIEDLRRERQVRLPDQQAQLRLLEEYSLEMNKLQTLVNGFQASHQAEIDKLAKVLPAKAEVPELIAQLEGLVQSSGFRLGSLEIAEEEVSASSKDKKAEPAITGLHALEVSLNLSGGGYPEFKNFLANLEKNLRLLDLISINFGAGSGEGGYSLILKTYYFEEL